MANQIIGRCSRCCSSYLRIMVTFRRPSFPMQIRYFHGWDADDDKSKKKNKAGIERTTTMEEKDSQINVKNNYQQYEKRKTRNVESNYSSLRVHGSSSGLKNPETSGKGNMKENNSNTVQAKYESDENKDEKQFASNNADLPKDIKIDDKGIKREKSIDFIKIIRGQCDEIEKLSLKLGNSMISDDKISTFLPKKNETKPLEASEGTGKSNINDKQKLSPEDYLAPKTNMNKEGFDNIKIFGGIPEAKKTTNIKASHGKFDKTLEKAEEAKNIGKIQGKQPITTDNKNIGVGKVIKKQLKSKETMEKTFDLAYVTQKDIDKWKKMESEALSKGTPIAMSVDMIPQNHLPISYDTMGLTYPYAKKNQHALNLGTKTADSNLERKSFTFEEVIAMTNKKGTNKTIEPKHLMKNESMDKKATESVNKTKGATSDIATIDKKVTKNQRENFFKETATSDKLKQDTHSTIGKQTSVIPNKDPRKDKETTSFLDSSTKASDENIYKSTTTEKTNKPVDLTKKPLKGTVAVLLEAYNKKRMKSQSPNLSNLAYDEFQRKNFVNENQAKTQHNQFENDKGPQNPLNSLKNKNETINERSRDQLDENYSPYINTEFINTKNYTNSMKIQSTTPDTKYLFNTTEAISKLKNKISDDKNQMDSKVSGLPTASSQFIATDLNPNIDCTKIKSECDLTPGDLYNTKHETITCDKYAFEEQQESVVYELDLKRDKIPERTEDKKKTLKENTITQPVSNLEKTEASPEQEEDVDNEPQFFLSETKESTEMVENDVEPLSQDNTIQNVEEKKPIKSNLSFAEIFSRKLEELNEFANSPQGQTTTTNNLNETQKANKPGSEATPGQQTSINAKDNLHGISKEKKGENEAKSTATAAKDNSKEIPKANKTESEAKPNEIPKANKSEIQGKPKSDIEGDAKKSFTEYLIELVTRKK